MHPSGRSFTVQIGGSQLRSLSCWYIGDICILTELEEPYRGICTQCTIITSWFGRTSVLNGAGVLLLSRMLPMICCYQLLHLFNSQGWWRIDGVGWLVVDRVD